MATAKTPRQRAAAKNTPVNGAAELLSAVRFVMGAQVANAKKDYEKMCQISDHRIIAYDGVKTFGAPFNESFECVINTFDLERALSRCGEKVTISHDGQTLTIASGRFKAAIPCLPISEGYKLQPDRQIAPVPDLLRKALATVAPLSVEGAATVMQSSVLLQANTCVASNGLVLLEVWHGVNLPPQIRLPKSFVTSVGKTDKQIVGFGFEADRTFTFWFEDGSFMKTQQFEDEWPMYEKILEVEPNAFPIAEEFYKAAESVGDFNDDRKVYFDKNGAHSGNGTRYDFEGSPDGVILALKDLSSIKGLIEQADFMIDGKVIFFGPSCRGAISKLRQ